LWGAFIARYEFAGVDDSRLQPSLNEPKDASIRYSVLDKIHQVFVV
jgi:hypothetical protein